MSNVDKRIVDIIVDKLGVEPYEVTPQASLVGDLGADSLDAVELVMEFEKEFGITISDDEAERFRTVGDIMAYLGDDVSCEDSQTLPPGLELFQSKLNEYLETEYEIVEDINTTKKFLRECENLLNGESDFIQASYRYLQALCCLQYTRNCDDSLLSKGEDCIRRAMRMQDDVEYKVLSLMYQRMRIDANDPEAYEKHSQISDEYDLPEDENYWLGIDNLRMRYEYVSWDKISDAAIAYRNNNDLENAEFCAELITSFEDDDLLVWAYAFLSDLYIREDGLKPESKGFAYAQKVADFDLLGENDFDEDNIFHRAWRSCIREVGYCCLYGVGTAVDEAKGFAYSSRAAEYNDAIAMYNVAVCYEYGNGTPLNTQKALEWYKAAVDAGFDGAEEDYNRLLAEDGEPLTKNEDRQPNSSASYSTESSSDEDLIDW